MKNQIKLQLEENLRAAAREYQPEPSPGFGQRLTSALAQARIETATQSANGAERKQAAWKWPVALASATSLLAIILAMGVANHTTQVIPTEIASRTTENTLHSAEKEQSLRQEFAALVDFFEDNIELPELAAAPSDSSPDSPNNWLLAKPKWEDLLQNPAVRLACSGENLAAAYVLFKDFKNTEKR
ncbi:MAG: hypothetical protein LBV12_11335 [Puniceicoccales bacterium]|jgi:hypothetical protein|nr:hypothetical protein [Puniceicoccales bacterium]